MLINNLEVTCHTQLIWFHMRYYSVFIAVLNNLPECHQHGNQAEISAVLSLACSKVNTGSQILFWHSSDLPGFVLSCHFPVQEYMEVIVLFYLLGIH